MAEAAAVLGYMRQAQQLYGKENAVNLPSVFNKLDEGQCESTARLFVNHLVSAVVEAADGRMSVEVQLRSSREESSKKVVHLPTGKNRLLVGKGWGPLSVGGSQTRSDVLP